ncbi:hypothetical protein mRhiFer1_010111 [Rhinolophus ferrumequinum]|uniref:Uncharacterized protein n=1 Tax=Rhinolophus ferrumequinum TaxID=59479 RepID=A0A7J7XPC2_RHIFE|nr:hypothetical protein mRhiFer1_010111 [Rhinolophus ferrumequinum]
MQVTKPRRALAALVPGEHPAEPGEHAQVAAPRLGKARAATVRVAPGPGCRGPQSLPARRPPGWAPVRAAHALGPPLKGPARSRPVLRLSRPSLRSKLRLGWRGAFTPLSPFSPGTVKLLQSCGGSLQRAKRCADSREIPGSEGPRSGIS